MKSKRQTTKAKLARERLIQERRALKREKKQAAAAAARDGQTIETTGPPETVEPETESAASQAGLFTEANEVKD